MPANKSLPKYIKSITFPTFNASEAWIMFLRMYNVSGAVKKVHLLMEIGNVALPCLVKISKVTPWSSVNQLETWSDFHVSFNCNVNAKYYMRQCCIIFPIYLERFSIKYSIWGFSPCSIPLLHSIHGPLCNMWAVFVLKPRTDQKWTND